MTKKEVNKYLLKKTLSLFGELGFKKNGDFITKINGNTKYYIGFGIVNSDNSFPITFHYGISLKSLNNIKRNAFPEKGILMDNFSTVYGINQKRLFENKQYPILEYDVYEERDIDKLVNDLYEYFINKALSFLDTLCDLKKLSEFVNSEDVLKESMHLPSTLINGLIISKLADNVKFNKFKTEYLKLVQVWPEWDRTDLNKVITFLDNHTQDELLSMG